MHQSYTINQTTLFLIEVNPGKSKFNGSEKHVHLTSIIIVKITRVILLWEKTLTATLYLLQHKNIFLKC